ncbi:MAG: N-acetylmuramoyl-L-alanine amidase family protein [Planctomycetota bacterium]|jgi:N-acetylmuramoyl-L-alanine amidase
MSAVVLLAVLLGASADLSDLHAQHEFTWKSDGASGREVIVAGAVKIILAPGLETVLVNGMPHRYPDPPRLAGGRIRVPAEVARLIREAAPLREPEEPAAPGEKFPEFSIVIDPGHGGTFTGGKGTGLVEKDVVLDVSLRLKKILEAGGVRVTMTRTTDKHFSEELYTDLQHRCDVVNRVKPDVFLSIHANWVPTPGPRGFEMWVPQKARGKRDRECRRLANSLRREFRGLFGNHDRGIKDEKNLYVLRNTACTAVLVEMEFLSNPTAGRLLADPPVRGKLAGAIAEALRKFILSRK